MPNKLIVLNHNEQLLCLKYKDFELTEIDVIESEKNSLLGNIYVGYVSKVVSNLQACFVDIAPNFSCFLPMSNVVNPILCNRTYDGKIKQGDMLLVCVEKDAIKTKQPVLTTKLSISGTYLVMETGEQAIGISSKLSKDKKEEILACLRTNNKIDQEKKVVVDACNQDSLIQNALSAIVRTNTGELASYEPFITEWESIMAVFCDILQYGNKKAKYTCLYKATNPLLHVIKNKYQKDFEEIVTDLTDVYDLLKNDAVLSDKVKLYQDEYDLKKLYSVSSQLEGALQSRVWLKSGAYLIIEHTEAMTVIDVNSGKKTSTGDKTLNFLQVNIEAAKEIAKQLKLRNMSGMILIDFINMKSMDDYEQLMKCLRMEVSSDPVKTDVVDLTKLGIVEVTRKRMGRPIRELF